MFRCKNLGVIVFFIPFYLSVQSYAKKNNEEEHAHNKELSQVFKDILDMEEKEYILTDLSLYNTEYKKITVLNDSITKVKINPNKDLEINGYFNTKHHINIGIWEIKKKNKEILLQYQLISESVSFINQARYKENGKIDYTKSRFTISKIQKKEDNYYYKIEYSSPYHSKGLTTDLFNYTYRFSDSYDPAVVVDTYTRINENTVSFEVKIPKNHPKMIFGYITERFGNTESNLIKKMLIVENLEYQ